MKIFFYWLVYKLWDLGVILSFFVFQHPRREAVTLLGSLISLPHLYSEMKIYQPGTKISDTETSICGKNLRVRMNFLTILVHCFYWDLFNFFGFLKGARHRSKVSVIVFKFRWNKECLWANIWSTELLILYLIFYSWLHGNIVNLRVILYV